MKWHLIAAAIALSLCSCQPDPKINSTPATTPPPPAAPTEQPTAEDNAAPLPAPEAGTDDMPPEDMDGSPTAS